MNQTFSIKIVSDVSCPWCIIGYKSLASALDRLAPGINAEIAWRPFELNPKMPAEGQLLSEHLHEKYGSTQTDMDQAKSMITARGAALGFQFNFRDEGRIYNTFNAHRLLYWARQFNRQTELKLALFELYFTRGGNPGHQDELTETIGKLGLPVEEARQILESDRYAQEVRDEESKYLEMGIHSVPTFIINGKYKITGGQPVDEFIATLKNIASKEAA